MADRGSFELSDNGAVTQSHELRGGSPVIGGGSPTFCTNADQISYARGAGNCDMGARETDGVPTAVGLSGQLAVSRALARLQLMVLVIAVLFAGLLTGNFVWRQG